MLIETHTGKPWRYCNFIAIKLVIHIFRLLNGYKNYVHPRFLSAKYASDRKKKLHSLILFYFMATKT